MSIVLAIGAYYAAIMLITLLSYYTQNYASIIGPRLHIEEIGDCTTLIYHNSGLFSKGKLSIAIYKTLILKITTSFLSMKYIVISMKNQYFTLLHL